MFIFSFHLINSVHYFLSWFVYEMSENDEKCPGQFSKVQDDTFKCVDLFDQQFKSQDFVYNCKTSRGKQHMLSSERLEQKLVGVGVLIHYSKDYLIAKMGINQVHGY